MQTDELMRLLEHLGVQRLRQRGTQINGLCPLHEESRPSFGVSAEKLLYNCYSCKAAGTVADLVSRILKVSLSDAEDVVSRFGANYTRSVYTKNLLDFGGFKADEVSVPESVYAPYITESRRQKAKEYLKRRGVLYRKSSTLNEVSLYLGYDLKTKRVLFPWFDMSGNFRGCTGRTTVDDAARYISFFGLARGNHLFLGCSRETWMRRFVSRELKHVIIVEGEIDAILITQLYAKTKCLALAVGSSSVSSRQFTFLSIMGGMYVCGFDSDDAGIAGNLSLACQLASKGMYGGTVRWKRKDAGESNSQERISCLCGNMHNLLTF